MKNSHEIDEKIEILPFDPEWSTIYKAEAIQIQKKLEGQIAEIQHIGSTAIPNIYSKPIIDIMIGMKNMQNIGMFIEALKELSYEYLGEANVPGRLYFRKRNDNNFNIALCEYNGEIWINNILFRDYLIKHPDVAKTYSLLKKNAFDSGLNTLLKYSKAKQPLIDEIIKQSKIRNKYEEN